MLQLQAYGDINITNLLHPVTSLTQMYNIIHKTQVYLCLDILFHS